MPELDPKLFALTWLIVGMFLTLGVQALWGWLRSRFEWRWPWKPWGEE